MAKVTIRLPSEVYIAGTVWTIDYLPNLAEERGLYGEMRPAERRILVNSTMHPDMIKTALLHEVLHACLAVNSAALLPDEIEERVVRSIEGPLLSFLKENRIKW